MNSDGQGAVDLDGLISEIAGGTYTPSRGSVGDRLLATHRCPCHGSRTLALFARAALQSEGLAWVWWLEADPATLNDLESDWIAGAWKAWLDKNRRPFGRKGTDVSLDRSLRSTGLVPPPAPDSAYRLIDPSAVTPRAVEWAWRHGSPPGP